MTSDDDMTPEEFDAAWEDAEPVEVVIPPGGIKRSRPAYERGTFASARTYSFAWTPGLGFQRRP